MSKETQKIGYLYLNGLGDGNVALKDKIVRWWWRRSGHTIERAEINWYNGESLADKEKQVETVVSEMLKTFNGVAIIGGSAGGSLAINVFSKMKKKNVCVITAHARVQKGTYPQSNRMSLYRRANLGTSHSSRSFFDSVIKVDAVTIPALSEHDCKRILVLTQLTDLVVDMDLMKLMESKRTNQSHSGILEVFWHICWQTVI